ANEVKVRELGVSEKTLSDYGAVSEETAVEMAKGIRRKSGADIGLSVTGFAGPDADEDGKSPGLIYVAIDAQGFTECEKIETGRNERDYNRYTAASRALNLIVKYLKTELKI
ncbi:MAG: CinA family protein, partial [Clostridia bacterium]|nr:CinA family protein [Clostridia bacterium]